MNAQRRQAAIEAGARALAPGSWEDEHWRSPAEQARSQALARYAAAAVIDAAAPHLVGEPVGYGYTAGTAARRVVRTDTIEEARRGASWSAERQAVALVPVEVLP